MSKLFHAAAFVLVLLPLASGCQTGMPRWDWWRSAQTGPPPGAMVAENNAPKYPPKPSTTATPTNMTASNGTTNPFPPGTSAPATGYPNIETATASTAAPTSYPSTSGSYAPQTGSYDANAYNPYSNAGQPVAQVASNPNAYGGSAAGYNQNAGVAAAYPSTDAYPTTNSPAYPSTESGYNAPASYGAPSGTADAGGYGTGSRYDTPSADRYGTGATSPAATSNGAPIGAAPAGSPYPATGAETPAAYNNYGAPNNNYPANPGNEGDYRGSDAASQPGAANLAATPGATEDRYSSYGPGVSNPSGPVATTADLRNSTSPVSAPHYDSAVMPAAGGSYLPAGTKRLEGEMPTTPSTTPVDGTPSAPNGNYARPGSMG